MAKVDTYGVTTNGSGSPCTESAGRGGLSSVLVTGPRTVLSITATTADKRWMDDSFAFRTAVPLRRRLDPTLVKAAVFGALIVVVVASFARWVVASERASFARTDHRLASSEVTIEGIDAGTDPSSVDSDAERATGTALATARSVFVEQGSFLRAGPAQLSALQPRYTFVDGPSTTPRIVSVASTADAWAAAAQDPDGTCHWIRVTSAGDVSRSIGWECRGAAALSPPAPR
ncbi:MAG: hypothetical protein M3138_06680 [Actinomycetota bacterium]|nr:hypothetical protein [Actinomycetota bacterium]